MMMCEHCDRGWHSYCLDPPLASVPPRKALFKCLFLELTKNIVFSRRLGMLTMIDKLLLLSIDYFYCDDCLERYPEKIPADYKKVSSSASHKKKTANGRVSHSEGTSSTSTKRKNNRKSEERRKVRIISPDDDHSQEGIVASTAIKPSRQVVIVPTKGKKNANRKIVIIPIPIVKPGTASSDAADSPKRRGRAPKASATPASTATSTTTTTNPNSSLTLVKRSHKRASKT